ncbi:MAG: GGDEF domain-containing protein [Lachnospiraceae bacterium]|nr:GGDEF domain-containing protein [Lachnospiraceae bacterium]
MKRIVKKILFLLSTWQEAYSKVILRGIEKYTENADVEVHVINAYGADVEYYAKEAETFLLVDVQKYDGVMMLFNGVGTANHLKNFTEKCIKYNVPAISMDVQAPGIAYCGIDNYLSTYNITKHLIEEHHVTKLQFVGGPDDHPDSLERGMAFCDCLKDHGLEPYGVGYYGFMRASGAQAYQDAKNSGRPMAEAYVCANDYNALGFCMAAKEDGLEPPRDFLITGFDNQEEAKYYFPSISTIDRDLEGLGYNSILHLVDIIEGKAAKDSRKGIPGLVIKGGSCGCENQRDLTAQYLELNNQFLKRNQSDTQQKGARERLCGNSSFEQYQEELRHCIEDKGVVDFRIGVNHYLTEPGYTKTEGYDDIIDVYGANTYTQLTRSEGLIPDDFRDGTTKIYWFGTLHCKERTLGYSIFKYTPGLMDFQYHRTMNETASLAVENIKQAMILSKVNQKLECLYIKDSLTGLYNRFGYNSFAGALYKKHQGRIYVVFIDMDNLKTLNDNYGHDYGDIALKGIAEAIRNIYIDTDVRVRMGGDEFLVLGPYVDEEQLFQKERQMEEYLKEYTVRMNLPVKLEVSIGHSFNEGVEEIGNTDLENLLQHADVSMYEKKQQKKRDNQSY